MIAFGPGTKGYKFYQSITVCILTLQGGRGLKPFPVHAQFTGQHIQTICTHSHTIHTNSHTHLQFRVPNKPNLHVRLWLETGAFGER